MDADSIAEEARADGLELFDRQSIERAIPNDVRCRIDLLEVRCIIDSTNTFLRDTDAPPVGKVQVCLADMQSDGRGRMGRSWSSPLGTGICLSLGYRMPAGTAGLEALGLAVGVTVLEVLDQWAPGQLGLKWPNDLMAGDGKVAGVLLEMRTLDSGDYHVIAGVGVNVAPPGPVGATDRVHAAMSPVALSALADELPSRNLIAAALLGGLVPALDTFADVGLSGFAERWRRHDLLAGRPVSVTSVAHEPFDGIADGISQTGALRVKRGEEYVEVLSADVSIRAGEQAVVR
jgi:BirA family biotin operon repressor/biotin-[acetyl-CoA-carboxylase] ligase